MVRRPKPSAAIDGSGRSGQSGQALVLALMAVLVLGAALALVSGSLVSRMQRLRVETRQTALLALSDAAVAESLANLAGRPSAGGVAERPFGGGTIGSSVAHGAAGSFVIVARSSYRGAEMAVEVRGRTTELGPRVTSWRRLAPEEADGGGGFSVPGR